MSRRSMRWRSWRAAAAALVVPLALIGCSEDNDPTGNGGLDIEGTWAFTEDGQTTYVRITDSTIEIFADAGACFIASELEIVAADGGVLTVDDGSGQVEWTVDAVGSNLVVEDEEGVSTTLTPSSQNLSSLPMCEPFDPAIDDFARPACSTLPLLALPGSVTGEIEPGDARFWDESWFDVYRMQIDATTDVNVTMTADDQEELNAYLSIYDASGVEVIDDDNSVNETDARVQWTLDPGCYYVVAGSYSGDDEGETGGGYTLTASTELVADFDHPTCTAIPEITVGGSVSGTLEDGDQRFSVADPSWIDLYSLQLDTEQTVSILLEEDGSGIDMYLRLYNSLGTIEIDADDDIDGSNFNSLIEDITLEPGCYIIVANSYEGDDEGEVGGAYTLSVD